MDIMVFVIDLNNSFIANHYVDIK